MNDTVGAAAALVDSAERVVVLTGAGISTDSGIPDFRGPNGLWTRDPDAEKAATLTNYVGDAELRRRSWARRATGELWADVEPNAGHRAIVALERRHKLDTLLTQNVDELHQRAGSDPAKVVEIHGTTRKVACLECGDRHEMTVILERVRAGEADPSCHRCGGILKSATISFGQSLVAADLARAEDAALRCDLMLAVGTSLQVFPIANVVPAASQAGARVVIVNGETTPMDRLADVVVNDSISDVLPIIAGGADAAR
ncbi:MAG: Sir2 family NAD-dependent protein deacetylase [Acidimicrobiia bacterium]|nr:Sir2 family NAD-dependent protein deacetylase [Acidimicrobiia bacterium]